MSFLDAASDAIGTASSLLLGDAEAPYALITSATRNIGYLFPDVTVRETHRDSSTITQHPVETGTPVSDHTFSNPKEVEIVFGYSDSQGGYPGYVQDQYQAVLALMATRDIFDVSTGKRYYPSMLFSEIVEVTDENFEFAGIFTVRLQEVIISETDDSGLAAANQSDPSATAPEADVGNQPLIPTSLPAENNAGFGPVGANGFANAPLPGL